MNNDEGKKSHQTQPSRIILKKKAHYQILFLRVSTPKSLQWRSGMPANTLQALVLMHFFLSNNTVYSTKARTHARPSPSPSSPPTWKHRPHSTISRKPFTFIFTLHMSQRRDTEPFLSYPAPLPSPPQKNMLKDLDRPAPSQTKSYGNRAFFPSPFKYSCLKYWKGFKMASFHLRNSSQLCDHSDIYVCCNLDLMDSYDHQSHTTVTFTHALSLSLSLSLSRSRSPFRQVAQDPDSLKGGMKVICQLCQ